MRSDVSGLPHSFLYLSMAAALVLLLISAGCTQAEERPAEPISGITVTQSDDSHITIAFVGAPGMDNLIELEYTVTDDNGKTRTTTDGSRLATTPIQVHSTESFTGAYSGKNHVVITGYFSDGSHRVLVEKDI